MATNTMIRRTSDSAAEMTLPRPAPTLDHAVTLTVFDLEYTAWECAMARHWLEPGQF